MFAGHIGVALAIGRVERRVNVAVFVTAALLLDILLWLFILVGWESVSIPATFAATHQPAFLFPYSHSLLAAGTWSALAGGVAAWSRLSAHARWRRVALLVGAAVFSHWLLDVLVHRPELPLSGRTSAAIGLALWNNMPVALTVEAAILGLGLWSFIPRGNLGKRRSAAIVALCAVLLAFTVLGMTVAPPPPSAMAMAGSSLVTLVLVCGLFAWLGRLPRGEPA